VIDTDECNSGIEPEPETFVVRISHGSGSISVIVSVRPHFSMIHVLPCGALRGSLLDALGGVHRVADEGDLLLAELAVPVRRQPGVEVRVFSGASGGVTGPTKNFVPVTMVEIRLDLARLMQRFGGSAVVGGVFG